MKTQYRIIGKAGTSRWLTWPAGATWSITGELTKRYNRLAKRRGLQTILLAPGLRGGDKPIYRGDKLAGVQGWRNGHGLVYIELREAT